METQKITAAAIFSKGGVQVKIWFTDPPSETTERERWMDWLDTGKIFQFKDDLQAGKFMWLAAYEFKRACTTGHSYNAATKNGISLPAGKSYFDCLTESGVFIMDENLHLVGFEGDKIYMRPMPEPPKEIKITFPVGVSVTPEERLADIARKQKVQKTITITGKTLWNYAWVGALIGLVIGIAWGLVLGAVYF